MQVKIQSCGSLNHALKWLSAFNDLKPHKKCDHRSFHSSANITLEFGNKDE